MKTKLGITAGLIGAATYLAGMFAGYVGLLLIAGYVLLCEENAWLRKNAVRALAVCFGFSLISTLIGFIPSAMGLIDAVLGIFGGDFYPAFVYNVVHLIETVLGIAKPIVLLLLTFLAWGESTIKLGFLDDMIDKALGIVPTAAPAAPVTQPAVNGTKFCTNCGEKIAVNAAFCPHCGNKG